MSNQQTIGTDQLSAELHLSIAKFIEQTSGVQLPDSKRYLIEGRLSKLRRSLGFNSLEQYIIYIMSNQSSEADKYQVVESLTTNKTDFFREIDHFNYLQQKIMPQLISKRHAGWKSPLRIWSAGSSTGEEAYSIAMLLCDMQRDNAGFNFEIFASDISEKVLKHGQRAVYDHHRIEPVPMSMRKRYLLKGEQNGRSVVKMDQQLRSHVCFKKFNLLKDNFHFVNKFDLIFCRNVMIYFNKQDRDRLVTNFTKVLSNDGYLFIGHSERLNETQLNLSMTIPTVYQKQ